MGISWVHHPNDTRKKKKKNIPYGSRRWFKSQLSRATTRYGVVVFGAIIVFLNSNLDEYWQNM